MISKAELQYVNAFARNAPYPGDEYALIVMENLKKAYDMFITNYANKKYNIILSDGEEIVFEILTKNLAHMLGIDFKNLTSEFMTQTLDRVLEFEEYEKPSSIDLLSRILLKYEDVIKNDSMPRNYKIINYYKVMIKCAVFTKLLEFDKFNFGCINFRKNIYENKNNEVFNPQSTKFFFTQSDEVMTPYFMMGLKQDEFLDTYIPETLFASSDYWKFFYDQELVLPVQILINDNESLTKIQATNEEKINLLNMYKSIITTYNTNSSINIFSDYQSILMENKSKTLVR